MNTLDAIAFWFLGTVIVVGVFAMPIWQTIMFWRDCPKWMAAIVTVVWGSFFYIMARMAMGIKPPFLK